MEKWFFLKIPNDFAFSLYDLDWDVFTFNIEGAINRVPAIEKTGVKSTVCGPGTSSFYNCKRQIIYGSRYLVSVNAQQRLVLLFIITLVAIQVVITYANLRALTNTLGAIQVVITYANLRALTNTLNAIQIVITYANLRALTNTRRTFGILVFFSSLENFQHFLKKINGDEPSLPSS